MLRTSQILVRALALAALAAIAISALLATAGCGQPGALYLPTEPAAAHRATLPQAMIPGVRSDQQADAPASPSSAPAPVTEPAPAPARQ